ncbi:MAG TPA: hypothetical protein VGE09_06555 [Pseudoxanthomonas sp.]
MSLAQAANVAADKPQSPVESVTEEIRRRQSDTHDLIGTLLDRLEPVLRHKVPSIGTASSPAPAPSYPSASPLHGDLVDRLDHAKGINERLQDILDRLVVG